MQKVKKKCSICGSVKQKEFLKKKGYSLVKCEKCEFLSLYDPSTKQIDHKRFYSKNYFDERIGSFSAPDAKRKVDFVEKFLKRKSNILDFGCGLGDFAGLMVKRGYRIKCCDLSSYSAKHVFKNYKIKVKTEDIKNNSYEENSLDAVTCFDTIEHVSDFADITGYFNRWIKKGGFLFITTPNTKGWDARVFGKKWYGYTKIPEHLNYFSPENISVLLKKNGFEVEKIIPNWGFVRSLEFITGYLKIKTVSLKNIFLTVPMTDMMVVAKNVKKN